MRIRRTMSVDSLRADRSAESGIRIRRVEEETTTPATGTCGGNRKSANARRASAAEKDAGVSASELWKQSRRDFATRFQ